MTKPEPPVTPETCPVHPPASTLRTVSCVRCGVFKMDWRVLDPGASTWRPRKPSPEPLAALRAIAEPGTRVRADGDVIYMTEDLEIRNGTEGTIVEPSDAGASYVRWDVALKDVVLTSHDSLALVLEDGVPQRRCPTCGAAPAATSELPLIACIACGWSRDPLRNGSKERPGA